jgi:peptidoglycan/xylan/chitin deacetylase (PgdA/CDA1 family)
MRLFSPGLFAGWIYPDALFRIRTPEKLLFLTFDDGPDPDSTPYLLDILDKYNIEAVFFCNGRQAEKYPHLMDQIKAGRHLIGNHGYSHLNGWITSMKNYLDDVNKAIPFTSSDLFRPPYGRLRLNQYSKLKKTFKIIFWDIMPYDFDSSFGPDNSLQILRNKIRSGSVIVLHDTSQSAANKIVEEFVAFASNRGFRFDLP